ncbi:MAG: hypothetical protein LWX11_11505, partial [Firmicutes bacterium]|nr:hypothetical protein [Bacillota bacterium]
MARLRLSLLLLPGLVASAAETPSRADQDQALVAQAKQALASNDRATQQAALAKLKAHRFRSTRAPEREFALFAQAMLEDRLEGRAQAVTTFKKLERAWPASSYLGEAQVILGEEASEKGRHAEAETRLGRALASQDLPVETRRRAQEALLWSLVERKQFVKALTVVDDLRPLNTGQPTEKGLAAMVETLAQAGRQDQAQAALDDYRHFYPQGALLPRLELAQGRVLAQSGDAKAGAAHYQAVLKSAPGTPEADEARLALATLLTEGKLKGEKPSVHLNPDQLLAEIRATGTSQDLARRVLFLKLRRQIDGGQWDNAMATALELRSHTKEEADQKRLATLRAEALRGFAEQKLEGHEVDAILPYLDGEGIAALSAQQRSALAQRLAQVGLPSAAHTLAQAAPKNEQAALRKQILEATDPSRYSETTALGMASPKEALAKAAAAWNAKDYGTLRQALGRAQPGAERIALLTAYLRRPAETGTNRRQEAEGWLAKAPEKGETREPLTILVADLRVAEGDWKNALALYPAQPRQSQRGWVALMRATCQIRLGQKEAA